MHVIVYRYQQYTGRVLVGTHSGSLFFFGREDVNKAEERAALAFNSALNR